ncbi:MAG: cation:proton antiporter, partial [Gemmatimonadota bacterium]
TIVTGAALTATSVGITARVLSDLGRLADVESQIVLGAAVIDDIVGLIILAIVGRLVAGAEVTASTIGITTAIAFGFVVVTLAVGRLVVPPIFEKLAQAGREEALATMALAFAFLVSYLADLSGSALIIGAFVAGIVLEPTSAAAVIEREIVALGSFFVPIFFVVVGAAVDLGSFAESDILITGLLLIVVAMAGKLVAGYVPFWSRAKKSVIGVGLAPRGEVGLIFAQLGLATGALDVGLFSALTMMVLVTTFVAPPLLRILFPPRPGVPPERAGGVAEVTTEA